METEPKKDGANASSNRESSIIEEALSRVTKKLNEEDNAAVDFVTELKEQFGRLEDNRKTLDSKANTMITISSSISTLLIAIGTLLIVRIEPKEWVYSSSIGILCAGIIFSVASICFLIRGYSLKLYDYPFGHSTFYGGKDKDGKMLDDGTMNKDTIRAYMDQSKERFRINMALRFVESTKEFAKINAERARSIRKGQWLLVGSVVSISVLLTFVLVTMSQAIVMVK